METKEINTLGWKSLTLPYQSIRLFQFEDYFMSVSLSMIYEKLHTVTIKKDNGQGIRNWQQLPTLFHGDLNIDDDLEDVMRFIRIINYY